MRIITTQLPQEVVEGIKADTTKRACGNTEGLKTKISIFWIIQAYPGVVVEVSEQTSSALEALWSGLPGFLNTHIYTHTYILQDMANLISTKYKLIKGY